MPGWLAFHRSSLSGSVGARRRLDHSRINIVERDRGDELTERNGPTSYALEAISQPVLRTIQEFAGGAEGKEAGRRERSQRRGTVRQPAGETHERAGERSDQKDTGSSARSSRRSRAAQTSRERDPRKRRTVRNNARDRLPGADRRGRGTGAPPNSNALRTASGCRDGLLTWRCRLTCRQCGNRTPWPHPVPDRPATEGPSPGSTPSSRDPVPPRRVSGPTGRSSRLHSPSDIDRGRSARGFQ